MSNELPSQSQLPKPNTLTPLTLFPHSVTTPIPPPPRSIASSTAFVNASSQPTTTTTTPSNTTTLDLNTPSSSSSIVHHTIIDDESAVTTPSIAIPDSITDPDEHNFLKSLFDFHTEHESLPLLKNIYPIINGQPLDLYHLFQFVTEKGGYTNTVRNGPTDTKQTWTNIYQKLTRNYDANRTDNTIAQLKEIYSKFLLKYESYFNQQQQQQQQQQLQQHTVTTSNTNIAPTVATTIPPTTTATATPTTIITGPSPSNGAVITSTTPSPSLSPSPSSSVPPLSSTPVVSMTTSTVSPVITTTAPLANDVNNMVGSSPSQQSQQSQQQSLKAENGSAATATTTTTTVTASPVSQLQGSQMNDNSPTTEIIFRFYITKNWLTNKKMFLNEKPKPVFDVRVALDNSPIAHAIYERLPILEHCNKFGEQLVYFTCPTFPKTMELTQQEERLSNEVMPVGSLAYWRAGSSLVLGWGSTPAASNGECRLLEPIVTIGSWINNGDENFSNLLTQALSKVTHTTTQLQLKRRIERTADKCRDLDYIIVEVQKAEHFASNDPNELARTLAKQVYVPPLHQSQPPPPPMPSHHMKSPATPTGAPVRPIRSPGAANLTNLTNITNSMMRTPTISPISPNVDKQQLPHPVLSGPPPPPIIRNPYGLTQQQQQQAQKDNGEPQFYDHKRKGEVLKPEASVRPGDATANAPNRPHSPQQGKPAAPGRYPSQTNMASRAPVQPPFISPMQYSQSQNPPRGVPARPGQKRPVEHELGTLDVRMMKRARLVKKVPTPVSLPASLVEVGKDDKIEDKPVHHVIIRYKYKGESDSDCRMIKKSFTLAPVAATSAAASSSTATTGATPAVEEDSTATPPPAENGAVAPTTGSSEDLGTAVLTGPNIIHLLHQDNVDLIDIEEVRYYENGPDVESSGWVLLENDYKCVLNPQKKEDTVDQAPTPAASGATSTDKPSTPGDATTAASNDQSEPAKATTVPPAASTKTTLKLLLKK